MPASLTEKHTDSDCLHSRTTAPIAVGGHNTDSAVHIVGHSNRSTCTTGGEGTDIWTDSVCVVDWNPTIILWGLPLDCEGHIVPTIISWLNSVGRGPGKRGLTCWEE